MNGLTILGLLLFIIPVQLFFNYITSDNVDEPELNYDQSLNKRSLVSVLQRLEDTLSYYSTFKHFKELFFVPHRPKEHTLKESFHDVIYKDPVTGELVLSVHKQDSSKGNSKTKKSDNSVKYVHNRKKSRGNVEEEVGGAASTQNRNRKHMPISDNEMSEASEVEKYYEESVYFAKSTFPRTDRPAGLVKYGIGQVVRHTHDSYHGVIVGWDERCKAPEWWLNKHGYHTDSSKEGFLDHPHYLVLVDTTDVNGNDGVLYYLPQQHLQLDRKNIKVMSRQVEEYFSEYSSSTHKYIPRDWLKKRYPKD